MISKRLPSIAALNSVARRALPEVFNHVPPPILETGASLILGFTSRLLTSPFPSSLSSFCRDRTDFENSYGCRRASFSSQASIDLPAQGTVEVPLAQTGEGIAECELLKWFVKEGDQVEEFQQLCEVQSDKATIEITSRYKGTIQQILCVPGDIVKVGETILKIFVEVNQAPPPSSDGLDTSSFLNSETPESNAPCSSLEEQSAGKALSTPPVRAMAKQYGVDINDIKGTGKDGRVLKEDVLNYAANKGICNDFSASLHEGHVICETTSHPEAKDLPSYENKTVLLRGFYRAMVKTMSMAAKVPHFHYVEEINCNALVKVKAAFQTENTDPDVKHTYLPFLVKSLSMALSKYPLLNSSFLEETNEVILKGSHNIGIAMATAHGLVVPNVKKVQSLSILEITKELSRLQQMASNNKLNSEDISDGTITLSNIGTVGGKFGCPLLNLPEAAIIAIGRIQKLPRFANDGTVYPAAIANVAIGADHRIVDGATVARFCNEWKLLIEKPDLLLLHMR